MGDDGIVSFLRHLSISGGMGLRYLRPCLFRCRETAGKITINVNVLSSNQPGEKISVRASNCPNRLKYFKLCGSSFADFFSKKIPVEYLGEHIDENASFGITE